MPPGLTNFLDLVKSSQDRKLAGRHYHPDYGHGAGREHTCLWSSGGKPATLLIETIQARVCLDYSNRLAPGWGHLPFAEIFEILEDIGYDGWITAEILPWPDPDAAARQAVRFLRARFVAASAYSNARARFSLCSRTVNCKDSNASTVRSTTSSVWDMAPRSDSMDLAC